METQKMSTEIASKTAAESRRDLCSEAQSWGKYFTKKHTIYAPTPGGARPARTEEFPAAASPPPITPRDEISRSGNPSLQ